MINAVGVPETILLLGGNSDIAVAIAQELRGKAATLRVMVAARPGAKRDATVATLQTGGCEATALDFDALDTSSHARVVADAARDHDIDVAVVAFGVLGEPEKAWTDAEEALHLARVNYVGAVSVGVALGQQITTQGHGVVVALSSVAGERPRRSNFVYGSTKAGMDAFYTGLGEALREVGGRVIVVRPGFVHSSMTEGLDAAPLATTPKAVAEAVAKAIAGHTEQVWVPAAMRGVMSGLRHMPRPIFRKLPL